MKELSIFNQLRPISVGYDSIFDHFERLMGDGDDFFRTPTSTFPFYNIVKTGNTTYDIEVALAGYGRKDIKIDYADNLLTIKSVKEEKNSNESNGVIHRGIAKRYFSKVFTIADDVEIKGAELKDGLLRVSLERIVPEAQKPRVIDIK
ncbi:MAG: Hsp20 family protein [Pelagibacteraceae bacterium]|jgi:molecular chaperone IbpA|nr:Hsp20 family protein [Pelagibacteraceae bacterium]MBO6492060.1 Hsp20 family protein [Pelagibacteraceae bacterium]|tara:strand:+ start:167 stop:610 length:444 start_codon:yes stop_codon:yes gene_type:complete